MDKEISQESESALEPELSQEQAEVSLMDRNKIQAEFAKKMDKESTHEGRLKLILLAHQSQHLLRLPCAEYYSGPKELCRVHILPQFLVYCSKTW